MECVWWGGKWLAVSVWQVEGESLSNICTSPNLDFSHKWYFSNLILPHSLKRSNSRINFMRWRQLTAKIVKHIIGKKHKMMYFLIFKMTLCYLSESICQVSSWLFRGARAVFFLNIIYKILKSQIHSECLDQCIFKNINKTRTAGLVPSLKKKKNLSECSWHICHFFLKPNDKWVIQWSFIRF